MYTHCMCICIKEILEICDKLIFFLKIIGLREAVIKKASNTIGILCISIILIADAHSGTMKICDSEDCVRIGESQHIIITIDDYLRCHSLDEKETLRETVKRELYSNHSIPETIIYFSLFT